MWRITSLIYCTALQFQQVSYSIYCRQVNYKQTMDCFFSLGPLVFIVQAQQETTPEVTGEITVPVSFGSVDTGQFSSLAVNTELSSVPSGKRPHSLAKQVRVSDQPCRAQLVHRLFLVCTCLLYIL